LQLVSDAQRTPWSHELSPTHVTEQVPASQSTAAPWHVFWPMQWMVQMPAVHFTPALHVLGPLQSTVQDEPPHTTLPLWHEFWPMHSSVHAPASEQSMPPVQ
jgi:hypothetical protein